LKDKIENHKKNWQKSQGKKPRNQKKTNWIEIFIIIEKKNHKIDLKDKIESIKTLTKEKRNKIRNQK